jgi:ATP synthase delta (OSCP) subunit
VRELPESLYSPEQLQACAFELDVVISWRRRQDIKKQSGYAGPVTADFELGPTIAGLLGTRETVARMPLATLEEVHKQLNEWLAQPVTHVTFAVSPPTSIKVEIVKWFRAQVLPTALVKFHVNGNIIGGMVVRTPNKIFDFSFRKQLLQRKSLIPEILKRV